MNAKGTLIGLSMIKLPAKEAWKSQNLYYMDFMGSPAKYIVVHCEDDRTPFVLCLPFHPRTPIDLIKLYPYYVRAAFWIREPIFINGTPQAFVLLPFMLLLNKKFRVLELGDWPSVAYWDYYYNRGPKLAVILKNIVRIARKIVWLFSETYITNSITTYKELKGRKVIYKIQRLKVKNVCISQSRHRKGILVPVRMVPHKGVHRAIIAYLLSRNFKEPLYIVGDGPLRDIVKKVAFRVKSVKYLGLIERKRLFKLMSEVKAMILPSHTEGFPNVVLESIRHCVPLIIIFKELDLSDYVSNIHHNIIVVESLDELVEIIKSL